MDKIQINLKELKSLPTPNLTTMKDCATKELVAIGKLLREYKANKREEKLNKILNG